MNKEEELINRIIRNYVGHETSLFDMQEWVKAYAREVNAPTPDDMLPNWIFKVGVDHTGTINYQVNGAFMYLSEEEMKNYRQTIVEAIWEAERFYRSRKPQTDNTP